MSLNDCGGYEALSYTWENYGVNTERAIVNGQRFPIMPNLHSALRHLRWLTAPRLIWIDFICINQDDHRERAQQVSIMPVIYRQATNVIIWLGPEKEGTAVGMKMLAFLSSETGGPSNPPWAKMSPEQSQAGLQDVMSRAWFERIWVVQESALSQQATVVCGKEEFSWNSDPKRVRRFIRMIKYAEISPEWEEAGLKTIDMKLLLELLELQERQILGPWAYHHDPDILDVAHSMRHRLCADPRDRLFAFMGISGDPEGTLQNFQPDYSASLQEVHERLKAVLNI